MKRIIYSTLLITTLLLGSCSTLKNIASNLLTEADAANAIREALIIGTNTGASLLGQKGAFSKDMILSAVLPHDLQTVVQTLDRLGLTSELNRFSATLDNAATATVTRSAPIFISGIKQMSIRDAIAIVKNGCTSATDYLRRNVVYTLRNAVRPVMRSALDEYRIEQEWDKLVGPAKILLGNKAGLNLNLDNILSVLVTNEMFKKIETQEMAIRTNAQARTTASLQRVFGRDWNTVSNP